MPEDQRPELRSGWADAFKSLEIKPPAATIADDARRQADRVKLDAEFERIRHETVMSIIGRMGGSGRMEFNPGPTATSGGPTRDR